MVHSIHLNVNKIVLYLVIIALIFAAITTINDYLGYVLDSDLIRTYRGFFGWFHTARENSAATWFSSFLWMLAALPVAATTVIKFAGNEPYRHYWLGLTLLVLGMSSEEIAALHEQLMGPLAELVRPTYFLSFPWVLGGLVVVAIVVLVFVRFWWRLPSRTRWLFALAAIIYIGGSVALEMVGANTFYLRQGPSFRYAVISVLEELAEMLGAILFLYANLDYLSRYAPEFRVVNSLRQRED